MKKNSCYVVMLVFAFILFVTGASAQGYGDRNTASNGPDSGIYAIAGKVVMPDGTPAKHVRVSYSSTAGASNYAETDEEGTFRFNNIPTGNYTVTARTEGLPAASESITLRDEGVAGQATTVVIYIRNEGQKKGDLSANPMFKDVPKEAIAKYQKAGEKANSDPKGALALLDEAIAAYPNFAMAHYEKGVIYQKQNDLDNAMLSFQKAIAAKPDFLDAKMSYGATLLSMKSYDMAIQVYQDVIKQKNDVPESYLNIGIALVGLQQYGRAAMAFKYVLAMKGGENLAVAHRYLGGIYVATNHNPEALTELQKYLELVPKAPDAEKIKATIEDLKKKG